MNIKTVKVPQKLIHQIDKDYVNYRAIIWSICTDASELVEYLMGHGYSRRKAFQIFCSFAYATVRQIKSSKIKTIEKRAKKRAKKAAKEWWSRSQMEKAS